MLHKQPNIDLMNEAAKMLLQHKNFGAFCKAGAQSHTDVCNVTMALWSYDDKELIFTIQANRFLRNMVRAVVGTLLQVGFGDLDLLQFQNILYSQNRSKAGQSMPAEGLFLVDVFYPDWVYIK